MGRSADNGDSFVIKKETVDLLLSIFIGAIPQPLIAYTVMKMNDEGWSLFWWVIAAINGFYLLMWIINTVIVEVFFKLYFKTRLVETAYKQLDAFKFPSLTIKSIENINPEDFYYELYEDESLQCNVRIRAAIFYNEYRALTATGSFLAARRMNKAHREAMIRYANKYPERIYGDSGFYAD